MNTNIECSGELEKKILEHQKKYFPHIKSLGAYFLEIARQRAEKDKEGE